MDLSVDEVIATASYWYLAVAGDSKINIENQTLILQRLDKAAAIARSPLSEVHRLPAARRCFEGLANPTW